MIISLLAFNNAKAIVLNEIRQSSFNTLKNANDYFFNKFMADMEYVVEYWAQNEEIINYKHKPGQPKMVTSIPELQSISNKWMGYVNSSPYIAWIYLGCEEDGSILSPL